MKKNERVIFTHSDKTECNNGCRALKDDCAARFIGVCVSWWMREDLLEAHALVHVVFLEREAIPQPNLALSRLNLSVSLFPF